jgi:hypothetical protein
MGTPAESNEPSWVAVVGANTRSTSERVSSRSEWLRDIGLSSER